MNGNDLTGRRFGKLTVLRRSNRTDKNGHTFWLCRCDCGNEITVQSSHITSRTSPGCVQCKDVLHGRAPHVSRKKSKVNESGDAPKDSVCVSRSKAYRSEYNKRYYQSRKERGCVFRKKKERKGYAHAEMIGKTFGEWTVISVDPKMPRHRGFIRYVARCSCGKIKSIDGDRLRNGKSKSCGHLRQQKLTKKQAAYLLRF